MKKKNIIRIALATVVILLLPLVAMQFTHEVVWSVADFAVAGALLFSTGLAYELVASRGGTIAYRIAAGLAIGTAFLLTWVNLAVGLIGSGANLANLMYIGVLAVGITGAVIAHYRPLGMARALFATALAQVLVPVIALIIEKLQDTSNEVSGDIVNVFGVTAFFVILWIASALLFRHASSTGLNLNRQAE